MALVLVMVLVPVLVLVMVMVMVLNGGAEWRGGVFGPGRESTSA